MSEEELLELVIGFLPDTLEGWTGVVLVISAMLSLILPAPRSSDSAFYKGLHKALCIISLGTGKLKTAGRIGRFGRILSRRK